MDSKKIYPVLISSFILFILFHSCSDKNESEAKTYCQQLKEQGINDNYEYPVVPGTNEWKAFESHTEMIEACRIPEEVLTNMCTHGLIVTCLNYPLLVDIFAFNIPQMGYESQRSSFNGLAELHNRPDVLPELMEFYENFDLQYVVNLWDLDDKFGAIDTCLKFVLAGMIIYQDDIMSQANENELYKLILTALNKHEFMRVHDHVSWNQLYFSNTTIMARAMLQTNFQPIKQATADDADLGLLIDGGFNHGTSEKIDQVAGFARQFVDSKN